MSSLLFFKCSKFLTRLFLVYLVGLLLVACTPAPIPTTIDDPLEAQNRETHEANLELDRIIVRPTANAYGSIVPEPVRNGIGNAASNLNLPGMVLNNLLQARIEDAGTNAFRFLLNTTFGLAGILDVATEAGIPEQTTDFGETLFIWGVREGNYIELPVVGPSTERHAAGRVVDTIINPLNTVFAGTDRSVMTATGIIARFGDRYRYSDLVDSILYESEDGYAQARLLYLQNRRFQLGGAENREFFDPYEDVYGAE
ncbi:MAG: VacJ family lipoprotein [Pseudomonadota bacterium]